MTLHLPGTPNNLLCCNPNILPPPSLPFPTPPLLPQKAILKSASQPMTSHVLEDSPVESCNSYGSLDGRMQSVGKTTTTTAPASRTLRRSTARTSRAASSRVKWSLPLAAVSFTSSVFASRASSYISTCDENEDHVDLKSNANGTMTRGNQDSLQADGHSVIMSSSSHTYTPFEVANPIYNKQPPKPRGVLTPLQLQHQQQLLLMPDRLSHSRLSALPHVHRPEPEHPGVALPAIAPPRPPRASAPGQLLPMPTTRRVRFGDDPEEPEQQQDLMEVYATRATGPYASDRIKMGAVETSPGVGPAAPAAGSVGWRRGFSKRMSSTGVGASISDPTPIGEDEEVWAPFHRKPRRADGGFGVAQYRVSAAGRGAAGEGFEEGTEGEREEGEEGPREGEMEEEGYDLFDPRVSVLQQQVRVAEQLQEAHQQHLASRQSGGGWGPRRTSSNGTGAGAGKQLSRNASSLGETLMQRKLLRQQQVKRQQEQQQPQQQLVRSYTLPLPVGLCDQPPDVSVRDSLAAAAAALAIGGGSRKSLVTERPATAMEQQGGGAVPVQVWGKGKAGDGGAAVAPVGVVVAAGGSVWARGAAGPVATPGSSPRSRSSSMVAVGAQTPRAEHRGGFLARLFLCGGFSG